MELLEEHLQSQVSGKEIFFWQRLKWAVIADYLPRAQALKILDIGAGAGLLGRHIVQNYPQVEYHFIEPIKSLEEKLVVSYGEHRNQKQAANFNDFAFVTLLDVLEHQENDYAFLKSIVDKMAVNSYLIISVPAMQMLWSQWDVVLGHYRRYSKRALQILVDDFAVDVVEMSYAFPEMVPLGLVRKIHLHGKRHNLSPHQAEFPDLPTWLNSSLYFTGRLFLYLRKISFMGTSIFAILKKTES